MTKLFSFFSRALHRHSEVPIKAYEELHKVWKELQITWEERGSSEEEHDVLFEFQHGTFRVLLTEGQSFAHIQFPFFHEAPFGALSNARMVCNDVNLRYGIHRASYTIDEEKHVLNFHLHASFRVDRCNRQLVKDFAKVLMGFFEVARDFRETLKNVLQEDDTNLEERRGMDARELFLLRENEIAHQSEVLQWREQSGEWYTLGELLNTLLGGAPLRFFRLRIVSNELRELTDEDEIAAVNFTEILSRRDDDGTPLFICENATLILELQVGEYAPAEYLVRLHAEDESEGTLYLRVTLVPPHPTPSIDHSFLVDKVQPIEENSFVMAIDRRSRAEEIAEFQYMQREAHAAMQHSESLTPEQMIVALEEFPIVDFNLYWGRRFMESKNYYRALKHLENCFKAYNAEYHRLDKKERGNFFELAYFIGFCYTELRLYPQAYYYLDMTFGCNSIKYTMEYVNALVNSKDYRGLDIIHTLLNNINIDALNHSDEEEEDPETYQVRQFYYFLKRRQGYAFIDAGLLNEAETVFTSLLDVPSCADYARHELAILRDIQKRETDNTTTATEPTF